VSGFESLLRHYYSLRGLHVCPVKRDDLQREKIVAVRAREDGSSRDELIAIIGQHPATAKQLERVPRSADGRAP